MNIFKRKPQVPIVLPCHLGEDKCQISATSNRLIMENYDLQRELYELKSKIPQKCPFCGKDAEVNSVDYSFLNKFYYVECNNATCNLVGPRAKTKEKAIRLWNKIKK